MSKNERLQALRILLKLLENKTPLTHLLQSFEEVTPLTKAICYGVCRHYFRLELLADSLIDKRPQVLEVWLALLMGLYQLQFLNKPEYATVKETVALLDKLKKPWAKGLVNAVLRRFCRERAEVLATLEMNAAFSLGHPEWFIARVKKDWPLYWQRILEGNDAHPPMSLRVNQRQVQRNTYLQVLRDEGIEAKAHDYSLQGIILKMPCDVKELPGFSNGDVSVQDIAAQLAVSFLDLKPGLRVLDACAAPGGKTCHILEAEPNLAECFALDIDNIRLQRVRENLERLHLKASLCEGNALNPASWWDGQLFDRILLDAPCSATGVIRRHPDIKYLRTESDIEEVVLLQRDLLHSMWSLLKVGGILVYATCSVMRQENDSQIAHFVSTHPDCQLLILDTFKEQKSDFGWQFIPGQKQCDGFFYSALGKR